MPTDASGRYIWIQGERFAYLFLEGQIKTALSIDDIQAAFDSALITQSKLTGGQRAYRLPGANLFDLLIVRDDKRCALVAHTPAEITDPSAADLLTRMTDDIRNCSDQIKHALGDQSELVLERLDSQIAQPF